MQMKLPAAIMWDMDGTLVDSEPLWQQATLELSESLGRRLPQELLDATTGGSFAKTLRICTEYAGVSVNEDRAAELKSTMFSRARQLFSKHLVPRPGVVSLLEELQALDVPMFVTTNTERSLADVSIDAVGEQYFTGTVCGDEAGYKPDPGMFYRAAALAGVDPAQCLVFDDSIPGITGGLRAGCAVVGLPHSDDVSVPEGALDMRVVHGNISFSGVSASHISRWFNLSTHC